jgi:hypothetical protein
MKKMIFLLFAASLVFNAIKAQVFIIERGSNTSLAFNNIKSAVDALEDNDRLYLPPGEISLRDYTWNGYDGNENYSKTLLVNKNVSIYGAGYADGANSTILKEGDLVIGKDANGSFVTGILFGATANLTLDDVSDVVITRCKIQNSLILYGSGNNIVISECEITSTYTGAWRSGQEINMPATFSKCIFDRFSNFNSKYASVSNSLFLDSGSSPFPNNSSFSNNIFVIDRTGENDLSLHMSAANNTFSYNLFIGGSIVGLYPERNNVFSHNIAYEPYENVFVNPQNADYHLKPECRGKNAASDGRDMGIFGTVNPFKESRLPLNPQFSVKIVSPETDADGKLPVNIKIEAQDN